MKAPVESQEYPPQSQVVTSKARLRRYGDRALARRVSEETKVVVSMFAAMVVASVISIGLFYFVTVVLAEQYIRITGALVHPDVQTNTALLHLAAQSSVLGGLGGSLFVMQQISNYIGRGQLAALEHAHPNRYFLYASVIPLKGLVAGIVGGCVVGGSVMMVGGMDALGKAHLLVIGCACIAGYSEQFLQHVVAVADRKLAKI